MSLANDVLARSSQREGTVRLSSQRDGGAQVTYRTYDDDRAEAEGVAASIADLIAGGMAPHSIAVLMRTNGQSHRRRERGRYRP
ncbi:ATP-dependent DNA helicase II UvrD2 [Mycobacteroides abscessus subsp. abscessus]|nr:ATP-dependent DNA helicase II UvrD2 [Mycobacteroides abscessus subsp. abscessus]